MLNKDETTRLHLAIRRHTQLEGPAWDWLLAHADSQLEDISDNDAKPLNYDYLAAKAVNNFYQFTMRIA